MQKKQKKREIRHSDSNLPVEWRENMNINKICRIASEEIRRDSSMHPNPTPSCLLCTKVLVDFFSRRRIFALPLVVRGVVLGSEGVTNIRSAGCYCQDFIESQIPLSGPGAIKGQFGVFDVTISPEEKPISNQKRRIRVPFSTVGYATDIELGSYDNGNWIGHLVAVVDNTILDLSIDQVNEKEYDIRFDQYLIHKVDNEFLSGGWTHCQAGSNFISYLSYPSEKSYLVSAHWSGTCSDTRQDIIDIVDAVEFRCRKM